MRESLLRLVLQGRESPSAFSRYRIQWEVDPEGKTLAEYMGITETELTELQEGVHSFEFIACRYFHRKHLLERVFPGAYLQFIAEYEEFPPHLEYGWADRFDAEKRRVEIQCDDSYCGNRSLEIGLEDIVRLLPTKERPNVFFKAMLCRECRDCSRESGEFVENCPFHSLFLDIKCNRLQGRTIIGRHLGHPEKTPETPAPDAERKK